MRRFKANRWCALILMLGLLLAGTASFAAGPTGDGGIDPIATPEGGTGGGSGEGDPDGPGGPNKNYRSGQHQGNWSRTFVAPSAGDGGAAWRGWIGRVQMVLRNWLARWAQF